MESEKGLTLECIEFVREQFEGEWGDDLIHRDAHKLEAFINRILSERSKGWQPIETAPRDGTEILVTAQHGAPATRYVTVAKWDVGYDGEGPNGDGPAWTDGTVRSWAYEEYAELEPTHWQPLPAPPVKDDGDAA